MAEEPYSATVDALGRATITIWPGNLNTWRVTQVSILMETAPVGAVCRMKKNKSFVTYLIPTGDAAGGDPPLPIGPADRMTVEWTGCTPGQLGEAFVFYEVVTAT